MSTHTGVNRGTKQTWDTAGMISMACQTESEMPCSSRQLSIQQTWQSCWAQYHYWNCFYWKNGELGKVHKDWVQQVKCGRNDCWVWRTYKDLVVWCAATACERYIKPEGENINLLRSYNAIICLPHSFLEGKHTAHSKSTLTEICKTDCNSLPYNSTNALSKCNFCCF